MLLTTNYYFDATKCSWHAKRYAKSLNGLTILHYSNQNICVKFKIAAFEEKNNTKVQIG